MRTWLAGLGAVFALWVWMPGQSIAEASWWETGVRVLKSTGVETEGAPEKEAGSAEIGDAFKEALRMGTVQVVRQLGAVDGFNGDPAIHVPLPAELSGVTTVMSKAGMASLVDDLELKLNRAAEGATPRAEKLFVDAIAAMTFDDIMAIYHGPENAATLYFQKKMSPGLEKEMRPIVETTLSQVGAIQAYDRVMGQYKVLPFVPDVKANLTAHVVAKGVEGIFYYMAKEEAAIRSNPAKQTTVLLKKVFGSK